MKIGLAVTEHALVSSMKAEIEGEKRRKNIRASEKKIREKKTKRKGSFLVQIILAAV